MPDATVLTTPETGPAVTPATDTDNGFGLYPGAWVSLDGTTTVAEDGTWLAVGDQGDIWVVTQIATNPTFTQLSYPSTSAGGTANVAEQAQPPVAGEPPGIGPAMPGQPGSKPPGAPATPTPVLPANPQTHPEPFGGVGGGPIIPAPTAPPHPNTPFGGAGGGLIIPDPNRLQQVTPIGGGITWVVDPPQQPGGPRPPGYFVIPVGGGEYLQLRPDAEGGWSYRVPGTGMVWLKVPGTGPAR